MPDGEVTLYELARNIDRMDARITNQLAGINTRFDSLQFVHRDTYTAQMGAALDRIKALEESKTWLARSLVAAFLVAFVAPLLVALVVSR